MNVLQELTLTLRRLQRHVELAANLDDAAILDMTHTLRIIADSKIAINQLEKFRNSKIFKGTSPGKKFVRAIKCHPFVMAYLGDGVSVRLTENRGEGDTIGLPEDIGSKIFSGVKFKIVEPLPTLVIAHYVVVAGNPGDEVVKLFGHEQSTNSTFLSWMGAEAAKIGCPDNNGKISILSLSRENLIRRVANVYGASHPFSSRHGDYHDAQDPFVEYLMRFTSYNLPLPYFILYKIANDILDNFSLLLNSGEV